MEREKLQKISIEGCCETLSSIRITSQGIMAPAGSGLFVEQVLEEDSDSLDVWEFYIAKKEVTKMRIGNMKITNKDCAIGCNFGGNLLMEMSGGKTTIIEIKPAKPKWELIWTAPRGVKIGIYNLRMAKRVARTTFILESCHTKLSISCSRNCVVEIPNRDQKFTSLKIRAAENSKVVGNKQHIGNLKIKASPKAKIKHLKSTSDYFEIDRQAEEGTEPQ